MPIFGLVWVASWVGCFFSSSQELLKAPEHPACVLSVQAFDPTTCSSRPLAVAAVKRQTSLVSLVSTSGQPSKNSSSAKNIHSLRSQAKVVQAAPQPQKFTLLPISYPGSKAIQTIEASLGSGKLLKTLKGFLSSFQAPLPTPKRPPVEIAPVIHSRSPVMKGDRPSPSGFGQCSLQQATGDVSTEQSRRFQVRYRGYVVGEVSSRQQATQIAQQLDSALNAPQLTPDQIQPRVVDGVPGVIVGDRSLFSLDPKLIQSEGCNSDLIAIQWVNNLRTALAHPPLSLAEAQEKMYRLQETDQVIEGTASWYGSYFHGLETATGEIFDQHEFTAAHRSLPFGTYLKVTNLLNGKSIIVRVNDRGPYVGDRTLDLSREAARYLDSESDGVVPIQAIIMQPSANPQTLATL